MSAGFTIEEIKTRIRTYKQITRHWWWFVRLEAVARLLLNIEGGRHPGWRQREYIFWIVYGSPRR